MIKSGETDRWLRRGEVHGAHDWRRCVESARASFSKSVGREVDAFAFLEAVAGRGVLRTKLEVYAVDCRDVAHEIGLEDGHRAKIA